MPNGPWISKASPIFFRIPNIVAHFEEITSRTIVLYRECREILAGCINPKTKRMQIAEKLWKYIEVC